MASWLPRENPKISTCGWIARPVRAGQRVDQRFEARQQLAVAADKVRVEIVVIRHVWSQDRPALLDGQWLQHRRHVGAVPTHTVQRNQQPNGLLRGPTWRHEGVVGERLGGDKPNRGGRHVRLLNRRDGDRLAGTMRPDECADEHHHRDDNQAETMPHVDSGPMGWALGSGCRRVYRTSIQKVKAS